MWNRIVVVLSKEESNGYMLMGVRANGAQVIMEFHLRV